MEYNELRDIMLEKEEDKKGKGVKKILILVAAFTIVFLVVLIVMKILNTNDTVSQVAQPDSRLVLPPEPDTSKQNPPQAAVIQQTPQNNMQTNVQTNVQQSANTATDNQKNDGLFQQVPIIPENKGQESFEDMVKALKEKETKKQEQALSQDQTTVASQPENVTAPKVQETPKPDIKPAEPKKQEQKISVVKPKEDKKIVAQTPKNTKQKDVAATTTKSQNLASGSYVQIFAVKHFNENTAEVKKLKASGYAYKLYETNVNGAKVIKVLIGPYSGKELATELANIRKNIASGAFVVNIK